VTGNAAVTGTRATDVLPDWVAPVEGYALGRFAPLRDVFSRAIASQGRGGGGLCIYEDGRPVVDLVSGDYAWDSLQLVFSVTKAATTTVVGRLVQDGRLDLDEPLSGFWPELDRPTTRRITLRSVMTHASGLSSITTPFTAEDLWAGRDVDEIGRQEPLWEPGTKHGYHALTFGALVDGALRRRADITLRDATARLIADPLGLDAWIGAPRDVLPRIKPVLTRAPLVTETEYRRIERGEIPADNLLGIFADLDAWNREEVALGSYGSVGMIADARSIARLLAATMDEVDGIRLIDEDTRAELTRTHFRGMDHRLGIPIRFGVGYQLPFPQFPMLGATSYGHEAAGGSVGFADPELGLSVGFTTDVFPPMHGSSTQSHALMAVVRHLATTDVSAV
jgi:Beta-lactamase class C and other penicillin binding proteins